MAPLKMYDAYRDSILQGIHQQNFKNGAFKNSINKSTGVVGSLDILLASSMLSLSEKEMIRSCRKTFIDVHKGWSDENPDLVEIFKLDGTFQPLINMFEKDAKARGIYVPPTAVQILNSDGSVNKTFTLDMDKLSVTETEGGIVGIPAGAPEEFIKANKKTAEAFESASKKSEGKVMSQTSTMGSNQARQREEVKQTKELKVNDDKTDFDKGFARNLRGAFK